MRCQEKVTDCTWKPCQPCIKRQPTHSFDAFTCPYCPDPGAHIFTSTCREDYKDKQDPRAFIKVVCTESNEKTKGLEQEKASAHDAKKTVQHCKWTPQRQCNLVHHNKLRTCFLCKAKPTKLWSVQTTEGQTQHPTQHRPHQMQSLQRALQH